MPPNKSIPPVIESAFGQKLAARAYYLRHPDASIADVARATGVSLRTVARCRKELVKEGHLTPGRNTPEFQTQKPPAVIAPESTGGATPEPAEADSDPIDTADEGEPDSGDQAQAPRGRGRPRKDGSTLMDDAAMRELAGALDELSDSDDIEQTRRRLLKQTQRFVFDPRLHPDTRMSASTLWTKLVDMARAKDLGPGKPLTLAEAIERATDFLRACGAAVAVPAFYKAFNLTEDTEPVPAASAQPEAVPTVNLIVPAQTDARVELTPPALPVTEGPVPPSAASPWG